MPSTLQALMVTVLAILPGALYIWAFERQAGRWGVGLADRVMRFVGTSAIFHAVFSLPEYWLYSNYLHRPTQPGHFRNLVWEGSSLPTWLALVPLAYVGLPALFGSVVGRATRKGWKWARLITGPSPAPRAWDHLFAARPAGTVRLKLKSGGWVGGAFDAESYAAGYPETPQDLFLEMSYRMNSDGSFVSAGDVFEEIGSGILIRWEEVEMLEFFETAKEG